jgi:hypothetical protein
MMSNNSSIRVSTSQRSGTLNYLHISEYGKLCAKYPEKAREVRTGAINTVQAGQVVFVESAAEGQEGHFFQLCDEAQALRPHPANNRQAECDKRGPHWQAHLIGVRAANMPQMTSAPDEG